MISVIDGVEGNALKEWKLSNFHIVDKRIKFYSHNTNLLPPKSKSSFRHSIRRKVIYTLLVMMRKHFSLLPTILEDITFGLVRMYATPYRFSWTIFILDLALSYTDKLLVFRLVQIVFLL